MQISLNSEALPHALDRKNYDAVSFALFLVLFRTFTLSSTSQYAEYDLNYPPFVHPAELKHRVY